MVESWGLKVVATFIEVVWGVYFKSHCSWSAYHICVIKWVLQLEGWRCGHSVAHIILRLRVLYVEDVIWDFERRIL